MNEEKIQQILESEEDLAKDFSLFERETSQSLRTATSQGEHIIVVLGRQMESLGYVSRNLDNIIRQVEAINTQMTQFFNELESEIEGHDTRLDNLEAFTGSLGNSIPSFGSTHYLSGDNNLEEAIKTLDIVLWNADQEEEYIRTFIGKDVEGLESPYYSSIHYVTQGSDLESAIGELDYFLYDLDEWTVGEVNLFTGRAAGEESPTYSSIHYVTQSADLETAVGELDAALYDLDAWTVGEIDDINSFTGRGAGEESPTYSSFHYVTQSSDLEAAIGALDAALYDLDTWTVGEVDDLNDFTGRGPGESSPTYSSIYYVTQSSSLESAISQLDASLYNLDQWIVGEIDDINLFTGRAAGQESPVYSSIHYVTQSADLEAAIGQLDAALYDLDTWTVGEVADLNDFTGRGPGESSPTYSSTSYVTQGANLEVAIGELDAALSSIESDLNEETLNRVNEDGYIQSFIGKNAFGPEAPSYSSTDWITQGGSLERAIGELDAGLSAAWDSLFNEDGYIRAFIGKNGMGSETPSYSSTVYVTQGADLEAAVGQLDAALDSEITSLDSYTQANRTEIENINSFIGKTWGETSPNYQYHAFLDLSSEAIEKAISDMNRYLESGLGFGKNGPSYSSTRYISAFDDIVEAISTLDQQLYLTNIRIDDIEDTLVCAESRGCTYLSYCF